MLVDVLVMLVVAVASLAVLMTVTRLWTAKVQGEGWLPWRVWMNRHPDLTPVLATPYGWIAALPIAVFIILPVIVLPTHPIPCPADRWATPEAYGHERLGERQPVHVHRHPVGDPVQHLGTLGRRRLSPGRRGGVRGVQGPLDVVGGAAGHLAERLAGDRRGVLEVLPARGRDGLAADPVLVPGLIAHQGVGPTRRKVHGLEGDLHGRRHCRGRAVGGRCDGMRVTLMRGWGGFTRCTWICV